MARESNRKRDEKYEYVSRLIAIVLFECGPFEISRDEIKGVSLVRLWLCLLEKEGNINSLAALVASALERKAGIFDLVFYLFRALQKQGRKKSSHVIYNCFCRRAITTRDLNALST